jgi:hypothetical protein
MTEQCASMWPSIQLTVLRDRLARRPSRQSTIIAEISQPAGDSFLTISLRIVNAVESRRLRRDIGRACVPRSIWSSDAAVPLLLVGLSQALPRFVSNRALHRDVLKRAGRLPADQQENRQPAAPATGRRAHWRAGRRRRLGAGARADRRQSHRLTLRA